MRIRVARAMEDSIILEMTFPNSVPRRGPPTSTDHLDHGIRILIVGES